jgi:hypothetical protein
LTHWLLQFFTENKRDQNSRGIAAFFPSAKKPRKDNGGHHRLEVKAENPKSIDSDGKQEQTNLDSYVEIVDSDDDDDHIEHDDGPSEEIDSSGEEDEAPGGYGGSSSRSAGR